jgi:hypothetical protein
MSDIIYINKLPLPTALCNAIKSGIWKTPENRDVWRVFFSDREIVQPQLYPLKQLENVEPWLSRAGETYRGRVDEGFVPGDIDPEQAVLIGDLGPDRLIALDYRDSISHPSVIALTSEDHSCWVRIAGDIELFMSVIFRAAE